MVDRVSPTVRAEVIARDGLACRYCGAVLIWHWHAPTLDHIEPYTLMPSLRNDPDNLAVACRACNNHKDAMSPREASMTLHKPRTFDVLVVETIRLNAAEYEWGNAALKLMLQAATSLEPLKSPTVREIIDSVTKEKQVKTTPRKDLPKPKKASSSRVNYSLYNPIPSPMTSDEYHAPNWAKHQCPGTDNGVRCTYNDGHTPPCSFDRQESA